MKFLRHIALMKLMRLLVLAAALGLNSPSVFAAKTLPAVKTKIAFPNLKLNRPLWLCEAPDKSGRLFVVEQDGKILILPKDRSGSETKTFLDITERKPHVKNEEGLLGFAFHPKFKSNGKFYIYYSQQNPRRSVISEFQISRENPDEADLSTERILMEVPQPNWNHNGGELVFGPDNYLYIGFGDGGGANNQYHNGQNPGTVLAKILRIDVDSRGGELPYGIPRDNPFVKNKEFRPEVFAWGFRNPWRFSFDRKTGELYCGDVGQGKWEEIDLVKKGGNYGWSYREGFHEFTNGAPANVQYIDPIVDYPHSEQLSTNHTPGLSVTGGYVYRGKKVPALRGVYVYADFATGTIWGLRAKNGKLLTDGVLEMQPKGATPRQIASFGEDLTGEVYVLCFDGFIYEFEEAPSKLSRTAGRRSF